MKTSRISSRECVLERYRKLTFIMNSPNATNTTLGDYADDESYLDYDAEDDVYYDYENYDYSE